MQDGPGSGTDKADEYKMPRGISAVGVFLFFGATMASIAGTTLTCPGTFLDRLWVLNPTAHEQLETFAKPAGILFLLLAAAGWSRTQCGVGMVVGRPDCRIDYGSNHREGRIRWAESKNLLPVAIPISRFLDPALISVGAALRITLRCPATGDFQRL